MGSHSIHDLFLQYQEEMRVSLQGDRANISHPSTKGDSAELRWIDMLKKHLPRRYSVEKAFILDHTGAMSDQIDVVVFDRHYTPLLRASHGAPYIPAEGVYAVFEVRQELSKSNIEYAGYKAASVRKLRRTSAEIKHAGGQYPAKRPHEIAAGLLTLESSWSPAFGNPFTHALASLERECHLDLGCCLRDGAWRADSDPVRSEVSKPESALISFFLNLLRTLQQVATVPAIDFSYYEGALGDE